MADESEDLYGDIDETPVFAAPAAASAKSNAPRSLVQEVQFLQDKVAKLEKENEVLKRNMGILFRTATAEIQRKDKEISRLNSEQHYRG